jgi:hypothetical protein
MEARIVNEQPRRVQIVFSAAFEARLADIEQYWRRMDLPNSFVRLVRLLADKVVPVLERFPAIGRRVVNSMPDTVDALLMGEELAVEINRAGNGDLHEYVTEDYVLLYMYSEGTVTFLSIRHAKEISFEFYDLWGGEP